MQDFMNGEAFRLFSEEPTEMEIRGYHPGKIFQISCAAAAAATAVGKTATRRGPSNLWCCTFKSVAQLVARRTHDRKVMGSIPTNAVCFTVVR